jgi:hypothetical protein
MQEMFVPSLIEIGLSKLCFISKDSFKYTNVKIVPPLVSPKSALSQKAFIKI